ncbi:probable leucine-rich repeat receptor-like protein kinase At1g68400 [Argentina anserina]|uniref:probable leucine-rich repeat receptor-like protein kinase At1g68400 n=1 Tax=Argentina anserina TaxID=57926 RepID=UPI00217681C4|nr:probable leucine-rich repeat receptor-like protein kinase At1g68400 [Potentilla anserina]
MLRNHHLLSPLFFFYFALSFLFTLSLSIPNSQDTLALLAFKASSDNNRSNSLASWAESTDPCAGSWLGVTCDPKTRRVTKLVLENLNLTGSIQPLTTALDRLRLLSLNHNFLSSSLNFSSWPHLKHIYLSHNNFTGAFPASISGLRNLRRLDLSHNQLSGEIPVAELTRLSKLLTLRLESNSLTGFGGSPSEASSVTFTDFNVSDNNLAGKLPIFLEKFGAASFSGNKLLCGKPLHQDCPDPTAVKPPSTSVLPPEAKPHPNNHVVLISVSVALGLMMIAGAVLRWRKSKKKKSGSGEVFVTGGKSNLSANGYSYVKRHYGPNELQRDGSHSFSYGPRGLAISGPRESEEMVVLEGCNPGVGKVGDLLKASAELLGKGSVGATYKIMMDGRDETVVVKRVRERRVYGKEVEAWLRVVGELKHPNIASLRAYHNSSYELLLVYDFFGNGSLHSLLHGFRGPGRSRLDWSTRMKLALGCAAGLAFIHGSGKGKLYHGHINSCNVFIDDMGDACVGDIGLQQLMAAQASSYDAYKAPELIAPSSGFSPSSKYTRKCDVYSFGVVLMEILTGRMAGEEGEMSLVEWVNTAVKKECGTWEVFDFELLSDKEMEEEMWALLQVGLLCLGAQPKDRPTMNMVINMMEDIRKKGVRADGTRSILDDISYDTSSASQSTP